MFFNIYFLRCTTFLRHGIYNIYDLKMHQATQFQRSWVLWKYCTFIYQNFSSSRIACGTFSCRPWPDLSFPPPCRSCGSCTCGHHCSRRCGRRRCWRRCCSPSWNSSQTSPPMSTKTSSSRTSGRFRCVTDCRCVTASFTLQSLLCYYLSYVTDSPPSVRFLCHCPLSSV